MPNKLNQLVCATAVSNTGIGNCFLDMEQVIGAFIVPENFELTAAEILDLQASLVTASKSSHQTEQSFSSAQVCTNV